MTKTLNMKLSIDWDKKIMEKKIITLDLTDCKYLGEIHERIRIAFYIMEHLFPFHY